MKEIDFEKIVKDAAVFAENRLPAHSDHTAYRSAAELAAGESSLRLSLDGLWKFHERNTMRLEGIFFNDIPNDLNLEDKFSYEEQRRREQQREETCSTK